MAEAHVLAMKESAANQTYNLEGPRKVTVLEVAEGIREAIGDHVKIEFVPARPGDFGGKEVSAGKGQTGGGWCASLSVVEGVERAGKLVLLKRWKKKLRVVFS